MSYINLTTFARTPLLSHCACPRANGLGRESPASQATPGRRSWSERYRRAIDLNVGHHVLCVFGEVPLRVGEGRQHDGDTTHIAWIPLIGQGIPQVRILFDPQLVLIKPDEFEMFTLHLVRLICLHGVERYVQFCLPLQTC